MTAEQKRELYDNSLKLYSSNYGDTKWRAAIRSEWKLITHAYGESRDEAEQNAFDKWKGGKK